MAHNPETPKERHEYYTAKAAEADEKAATIKDAQVCESWKQLAASWRDLAEQVLRASKT